MNTADRPLLNLDDDDLAGRLRLVNLEILQEGDWHRLNDLNEIRVTILQEIERRGEER